MMFLVLFASLAAAMAVATQGNLRSASSHLRVVRSLGAVDTGLRLGASRLREAARRVVVTRGEIDPAYLAGLWSGPLPADADMAPGEYNLPGDPSSIREALTHIHDADADANLVLGADPDNAMAAIPVAAAPEGWYAAPAIGVARNAGGVIVSAAQITYTPPDNLGRVRVIVRGYDWDASANRWVVRTAEQSFELTRRVDYAVVARTPVVLGAGGHATGQVGTSFDSDALDPTQLDGDPLRTVSDFKGLEEPPADDLDRKLDDLHREVLARDVDNDGRLRVGHAVEGAALVALNANDYSDDGDDPDFAFRDATRDGIVDEYDVFLNHFDANGDGRVVLSAALTAGTPAEGLTPEFTANDSLALLIDTLLPDRNANGFENGDHRGGGWVFSTFEDNNRDGTLDAGDVDADDVVLGYRDGVLDHRDPYGKIRGSAHLRTTAAAWGARYGDPAADPNLHQTHLEGPIIPSEHPYALGFESPTTTLPDISDASFAAATEGLETLLDDTTALTFEQQVIDAKGAGWTPPLRVEGTPFGADSPADYYRRPVYEGIVFKNVTIPMGLNALFVDCEFIGITKVETYEDNTHPSFVFYGQQERDPISGDLVLVYPPPPDESALALDTSYSVPGAPGYDALPAPLEVAVDLDGDGASPDRCYDTKRISNNIRFHDCLFVGSIVSDQPTVYQHVRNKLQFTGATRFTTVHPDFPEDFDRNPDEDHLAEIRKSSLMTPQYSVDIGAINPPPEQDVRLQGAIIAGVIDVRGDAEIRGVLLSTFQPVYGEAPLELYGTPAGNPANFNVTIGAVLATQGDREGIDPADLSFLDGDDVPDIGWDSARDASGALIPLSGWSGDHEDIWYDGVPDEHAVPGVHVRRAIPFHGFAVTRLTADPEAVLPDGLELRMTAVAVPGSYKEGS